MNKLFLQRFDSPRKHYDVLGILVFFIWNVYPVQNIKYEALEIIELNMKTIITILRKLKILLKEMCEANFYAAI